MIGSNKSRGLSWTAYLMASTMLGGGGQALAQESGAGPLDEIIVTAQRREENLQSVPASIQALGAERLDQLNVADINDYVQFLPSLTLQATSPGVTGVYMRGVASGENRNHSGPLPSVGVYLDEQSITTITGALDVHVYDIARVESLAGPQGTLYGASSQAGTVRIITNRPDPRAFDAGYDVEVNAIDNGGVGDSIEGFINIPLANYAAIRLVGWAQHDAGYIDNVQGTRTYPTCEADRDPLVHPASFCTDDNAAIAEDDYNDVDTYGVRGALRIDLNDNWTITPSVMAQDQRSHGVFGFDPQVGDLAVTHWYPESAHDRWAQFALTIQGRIGDFDVTYAGALLSRAQDAELDYSDYSFFYDQLLGYGSYFYNDDGDTINPAQFIQARDRFRNFSHEVRFASPVENRLRFIGGLFFQHRTHDIEQRYLINGLAAAIEVPLWPDTIWLTEQQRIDQDTAVFGEVSFDLTEQLTVTAGLRAFSANNSLEGFFGFGDGFSGSTGVAGCAVPFVPFAGAPCTNLDKSISESGTTERLNVTYRFDDRRLIYATYSTGFRPGGINRRAILPPYQSDFLTNYEIGWRTSWMDDRLRFNGAVFHQEWRDFQYSLLGVNGLTDIRNAGNATITGIESDVNWAVTDQLRLTSGFAYLQSETTEDICDADPGTGLVDCVNRLRAPAGTELPVTPELKLNATARYEFSIGNWDAFIQGALVHQSDVGVDIRAIEAGFVGRLPAFTVLDLSAGFETGRFSVNFYLDNATDERALTTRYTECSITVPFIDTHPNLCGAQPYDVPIQPRTFGVRFGQRF